jgi:hypothetical protein
MWAALHCVRFRNELGTLTARDAVVRTLESGSVSGEHFFEAAARRHVLRPLQQLLALE